MNMQNFFLMLFFFAATVNSFSQSYPEINSGRPRVLIPQDKFINLKSFYDNGNNNRFNDFYDYVISENSLGYQNLMCDNIDKNPVPEDKGTFNLCGPRSTWEWTFKRDGDSQTILKLALLNYHLGIEKDLQKERIHFIANRLLDYIKQKDFKYNGQDLIVTDYGRYGNYAQYNGTHESRLRQIAVFGSILLDWGYDALLDFEYRKHIAVELYRLNFTFMKIWVYQKKDDNNMLFRNDEFYGGHAQRNHLNNMQLVMSLYGYDVFSNEEQNALLSRYHFLSDKFYNEFLPLMKFRMQGEPNENITGEYNGGAYSIVWYSFIEYFELVHYGTNYEQLNGGNIYQQNNWVNNFINQYSALIRPDKSVLHLGDDIKKIKSGYNYEKNILSLSNHFNEDRNKFMLYKYHNENPKNPKQRAIEELLFREDLAIPESIKPKNHFPLNWFSYKSGHSVIKTSHEDDATMISYVNKTVDPNNHEHLDNNSFTIYKNGPLFFDSGTYDRFNSEHFHNYYRRTIAHNAITIHDPNEKYPAAMSNEGGQLNSSTLKNYDSLLESYDPSRWITYSKNEQLGFFYHVTDASKSYNENKVESYIRKFLYLTNQDRVIVIDYIKQPNNGNKFDVRWNAHFKEKPVVYNHTDAIENPASSFEVDVPVTANGINNNILIERYLYDRKYKVKNGTGGYATIKTLFPTIGDTQVKIIGSTSPDTTVGCYYVYGDNDEEGINYSPIYTVNDDGMPNGKDRTDGAKWRLEVSSINKKRFNALLHTIEIGYNAESSENESELISNQANSMTVGWDNDLYVFGINYDGENNTDHVVNLSKLEGNKHYNLNAFDLVPFTKYHLRKGNGSCKEATSNNEGFVKFNFYYDGNVNGGDVEILTACPNSMSKLQVVQNKISLKIFPNSIKSGEKLTIYILDNENITENEFRIYDLTGKLILIKKKIGNELIIDTLNFKEGIYILEMKNSDRKIVRKIIVN